jgi:hypothetical protein
VRGRLGFRLQGWGDGGELVEGVLEVFHYFLGEYIGVGEGSAVFNAFVFDPEEVEAELVSRQYPAIVGVKLRAIKLQQAWPVTIEGIAGFILGLGNAVLLVVGRLGQLVGHFEKQQKRRLFHVGHVGEAIILEHAGVGPDAGADDLAGGGCSGIRWAMGHNRPIITRRWAMQNVIATE